MGDESQHLALIKEIINNQAVILGPDIAYVKAREVQGLTISADNKVEGISGDASQVVNELVDKYISLSGQIVKNILSPMFDKYPSIEIKS
ncbi:MAG: hypothetical protein Q8P90_02905 [bacterium]|nr:hypothetical protein [bacterium]